MKKFAAAAKNRQRETDGENNKYPAESHMTQSGNSTVSVQLSALANVNCGASGAR